MKVMKSTEIPNVASLSAASFRAYLFNTNTNFIVEEVGKRIRVNGIIYELKLLCKKTNEFELELFSFQDPSFGDDIAYVLAKENMTLEEVITAIEAV